MSNATNISPQTDGSQAPVIILGAGVNGCALARELLLNDQPVWIVEENDISYGATSKSSRLIHGGLRYLEYGDFRLVAESLAERSHLRDLAPQFVTPLQLYIPVRKRFSGLFRAASRFIGLSRWSWFNSLTTKLGASSERGLWIVRMGIWLYDRFAQSEEFPKHRVVNVGSPGLPAVDKQKYRWLCAYYDAQMFFPERFCVALLHDASAIAQERGLEFHLFTHCQTELNDGSVTILPQELVPEESSVTVKPALLVNATGAWGDLTLKSLGVSSPRLMGGTKGSHFITFAPRLREQIGESGVYAEADDGRLIFVLPFVHNAVLVGTTDERFTLQPDEAIASDQELDYLIEMANDLFPGLQLSRDDVDTHYSGVRPLPHVEKGKTGAIPRGHWIQEQMGTAFPMLTLVGGKLTTARAFAEDVVSAISQQLNKQLTYQSRDRIVPGGNQYPSDAGELKKRQEKLAQEYGLDVSHIEAMWDLVGNRVDEILNQQKQESENEASSWNTDNISGTQLPKLFVEWVIEREWIQTLDDLVERRLMLVYHPNLSEATLTELAEAMVAAGRMKTVEVEAVVQKTKLRLQTHYGKIIAIE